MAQNNNYESVLLTETQERKNRQAKMVQTKNTKCRHVHNTRHNI